MDVEDNSRYHYGRDGAGNILSSTILVPSAKGERIVKFRQYTGNGHIIVDDSLKITRFPEGYFTPDRGVYLFGRSEPKCREFPRLNPYFFSGGDPVNLADLSADYDF